MNAIVTRQALNRHGSIGGVYDIRCDSLEDENVFNNEPILSSILNEECFNQSYFIDKHLNEKDTWDKLNIETSMQLSLRTGLFKQIPLYLHKTKLDSRTVRVTFVLTRITKRQYHKVNLPENLSEQSNGTHYISGITLGKRVFLTFEDTLIHSSSNKIKQLENELIDALNKSTIQNNQVVQFNNLDRIISKFEKLRIILTDGSSEEIFSKTDENLIERIESSVNHLINQVDQQIQFELYPLNSSIQEQCLCQTIQDRIENLFQEISKQKIAINDYISKIDLWKDWIPSEWINRILNKQIEINDKESQIKDQFKILIKEIRYGEIEQQKLTEYLNEFAEGNYSVTEYLNENSTEIDFKIKILSEFDRKSLNIKRPNANILLKSCSSIENFISTYYDHQIYLLTISNQWIKQDQINWSKQLRCFLKLQETDQNLAVTKPIFRVIDYDLHQHLIERPSTCTIYHAYRATILSRDFFRMTSLSKCQFHFKMFPFRVYRITRNIIFGTNSRNSYGK